MAKVIHLVRKFLPPTTSFIRNQIKYHLRYSPFVIFSEYIKSPFSDELLNSENNYYVNYRRFTKKIYDKSRILLQKEKTGIKNYILRINPDILHIHYGVDFLVYADIISKLNIPVVVSFYGYDCTSFPKRFYGYGKILLQKKIFNNKSVKTMLAMSTDMKEDLVSLGCPPEKICIHYYGTETSPFKSIKRETHPEVRYLIISGLHPKKGHALLIDAFLRASARTSLNLRLDIVGDGPLKNHIKKSISESGNDSITFHGPVEYGSKKHLKLLSMADVFIHPSITPDDGDKEGIPGAIIEAMAAGLPIISTFHAGIPYVIDNNIHGILLKEEDLNGLVNAILYMAENDVSRQNMGENARKKAVNELDVLPKEEELENIYDLLIDDKNKK